MTPHEIAFNHIVAKLEAQRADIANIRNQASISAAVSGLIAGAFATILSSSADENIFSGEFFLGFSTFGFFALFLFASSIAFSVMVVVFWRDFTFSFDAKVMLDVTKCSDNVENFFMRYVEDGEWYFKDNEQKINDAQSLLWWAMVLAFTQIIPWAAMV